MNSEIILVLIIMGAAALCVLLAAAIGLRWVIRRCWKNKNASPTPIGIALLVSGAAVIVSFLYAMFVEPYWLEVTHTVLQTNKISAGSKGFRIAHISDVHSDPIERIEDKLPAAIAAEKPDIIVFSGDCLNSPEGLPIFKKMIAATSKIAPTFVVRGNWDAWYWNKLDLFGGSSAIELNGDTRDLDLNGVPVSITGFPVMSEHNTDPVGGSDAVATALANVTSKGKFSVFLYHYPDLIEEVSNANVDLYCAGHTHGGQVRLPFYGALVTLSKFGKQYEAGEYHRGETTLYVNRGIGMEGGIAPRIRFLCRPELAIIDVLPQPQNLPAR